MSTAPQEPDTRRNVIVAPVPLASLTSIDYFWVGVASVISVAMHVAFIMLIMQFSMGGAEAKPSAFGDKPADTDRDNVDDKLDLTDDTFGTDPEKKVNYNVDLLANISVPGVVKLNETPGIDNALEAPPRNIGAPPGANMGTGLSPLISDDGKGLGIGTIGGMGGAYQAGGFGGRTGSTRQKLLQEYGGNAQSEASVAAGLKFLGHHQAGDGHWSLHEFNRHAREKLFPVGKVFTDNCTGMSSRKNDIAATGLVLLAFQAAGQSTRPSKTSETDYANSVKGGLNYLIRKQDASSGYFGDGMYAHGIATIAMCEAYAMTSDQKLKVSAQRGIDYIDASQDKSGGGWRYSPGEAGDLSVTGWQIMALKSGQMSGLSVKEATMKKAEFFLKSCEVKDGGRKHTGGYCYLPDGGESASMTAVGMLCAQYLGATPLNPELLKGTQILRASPPNTTKNLYYEYYATQVMHHMGGDNWKIWNEGRGESKGIRDTLLAKMDLGNTIPAQRGSWDKEGFDTANSGGRIMATALSLLTLEVYYRHLPLYRREMGAGK